LQVNDINIGALSQTEVVDMLRDFRPGDAVNLNISRVQNDDDSQTTQTAQSNTLPRATQNNNTKETEPPAQSSSSRIPQSVKHSSRERSSDTTTIASPLPRPMTNQDTIGERNRHKQLMVRSVCVCVVIIYL
jgi:hypothetical protein